MYLFSPFFRETFIILKLMPAGEDIAVHKMHLLTIKLYAMFMKE